MVWGLVVVTAGLALGLGRVSEGSDGVEDEARGVMPPGAVGAAVGTGATAEVPAGTVGALVGTGAGAGAALGFGGLGRVGSALTLDAPGQGRS